MRPSATSTRAILPQVVVLPAPLTPTTSSTAGMPSRRVVRSDAVQARVERGDQLVGEQAAQLAGGAGAEHPGPLAEPVDDLPGGVDADVGGDQAVLDLLPGVLVEVVAGEQAEQALAEGVLRAGQPGPQPDQPAGGRLGDLQTGGAAHDRRLDQDTGGQVGLRRLDGRAGQVLLRPGVDLGLRQRGFGHAGATGAPPAPRPPRISTTEQGQCDEEVVRHAEILSDAGGGVPLTASGPCTRSLQVRSPLPGVTH